MIRPPVARSAGAGPSGHGIRTRMPRVATGAVADGAVGIRFADAVALFASTDHGRCTFKLRERMRRTFGPAGLIGLRKTNLLRSKALLAVNGSPGSFRA